MKFNAIFFASFLLVLNQMLLSYDLSDKAAFAPLYSSSDFQYTLGKEHGIDINSSTDSFFSLVDGINAFKRYSFSSKKEGLEMPYKKVKKLAKKGDKYKLILGDFYHYGIGIKQKPKKAKKLYKEVAKSDSEGYLRLARFYLNEDLRKYYDSKKGVEFLTKAANLGNEKAKFELALLYYQGRFVKQDWKKTVRLLKEKSLVRLPEADLLLGFIYLDPIAWKQYEIPISLEKSLFYFKKGSSIGQNTMDFLQSKINSLNTLKKIASCRKGFLVFVNIDRDYSKPDGINTLLYQIKEFNRIKGNVINEQVIDDVKDVFIAENLEKIKRNPTHKNTFIPYLFRYDWISDSRKASLALRIEKEFMDELNLSNIEGVKAYFKGLETRFKAQYRESSANIMKPLEATLLTKLQIKNHEANGLAKYMRAETPYLRKELSAFVKPLEKEAEKYVSTEAAVLLINNLEKITNPFEMRDLVIAEKEKFFGNSDINKTIYRANVIERVKKNITYFRPLIVLLSKSPKYKVIWFPDSDFSEELQEWRNEFTKQDEEQFDLAFASNNTQKVYEYLINGFEPSKKFIELDFIHDEKIRAAHKFPYNRVAYLQGNNKMKNILEAFLVFPDISEGNKKMLEKLTDARKAKVGDYVVIHSYKREELEDLDPIASVVNSGIKSFFGAIFGMTSFVDAGSNSSTNRGTPLYYYGIIKSISLDNQHFVVDVFREKTGSINLIELGLKKMTGNNSGHQVYKTMESSFNEMSFHKTENPIANQIRKDEAIKATWQAIIPDVTRDLPPTSDVSVYISEDVLLGSGKLNEYSVTLTRTGDLSSRYDYTVDYSDNKEDCGFCFQSEARMRNVEHGYYDLSYFGKNYSGKVFSGTFKNVKINCSWMRIDIEEDYWGTDIEQKCN